MEASAARAVESPWVERIARFGLVAQGVSFGLVAVLAIEVALGHGGKATDREGALRTIADGSIGRVIVIALAVGFGAYALWRLAQAFLGHDIEERGGEAKWGKRLSSLGKAAIYASLCWASIEILTGGGGGSGGSRRRRRGSSAGPPDSGSSARSRSAILGAALWNLYRGLSGKYEEKLKTGEMSERERTWTRRIAFAGLVARAVVFGIIAWFFFKAATEYDAKKAAASTAPSASSRTSPTARFCWRSSPPASWPTASSASSRRATGRSSDQGRGLKQAFAGLARGRSDAGGTRSATARTAGARSDPCVKESAGLRPARLSAMSGVPRAERKRQPRSEAGDFSSQSAESRIASHLVLPLREAVALVLEDDVLDLAAERRAASRPSDPTRP